MKRFVDRKRTVNIALLTVAILGIILGGFTVFSGNRMMTASAPSLSSSSGSDGRGSPAVFGADFYTYIYDITRTAATNAGNTATGVSTVNENLQKVVNAQYKAINNAGLMLAIFGGFMIVLFAAVACSSVKINPCYQYDESKDRKYQKRLKSGKYRKQLDKDTNESTITE